MALFVPVLIAIGVVVFTLWHFRYRASKRLLHKLPSLPTIPLLGNIHQYNPEPSGFFAQTLDCALKCKEGIFCMWFGEIGFVMVYKEDYVEALCRSSKHLTKSSSYAFFDTWLRTGLLTSGGAKWFSRRKLLTPTFHFKILNDFVSVFNSQSRVMTENLRVHVGGGKFDVFQYITLCTLDIICETAMGRCINAQNDKDSAYIKAIHEVSNEIQIRFRTPWLHNDFLFNTIGHGKAYAAMLEVLHGFTRKIIEERRREFKKEYPDFTLEMLLDESGKKRRLAFLDMLLCSTEDGSPLSMDSIQEEVDTFMFEGHDTTAAAATWATYLIGSHPDVQKKLQDELDRVIGKSDRTITSDHVKELSYLDCIIKESLRLYPSVPFFGRETTEDVTFGGYDIPKGTDVFVFCSALHRDPVNFPDPEKFDPERFTQENYVGRHPFAYVPFSAGPRNCIGQKFAQLEEKILLASLFRKYNVTSEQSVSDLHPSGQLILRPRDGLFITITERT